MNILLPAAKVEHGVVERAINDHADRITDIQRRMERLEKEWRQAPLRGTPAHEWQPMSTAPRDGRWVLLRFENLGSHDHAYTVAHGFPEPDHRNWRTGVGDVLDRSQFDGWLPIPGEPAR